MECGALPPLTTNLNHFYPVAERRQQVAAAVQIPLDGIWFVAAGIRSTANGYIQNLHNKKQEAKIPLLKVLEGS